MPRLSKTPTQEQSTDQIRSYPCPNCCLCSAPGQMLYEGLKDTLYGAVGSWNFKRCSNSSCGLLWLDPMPLQEDIGAAYTRYHTHSDDSQRPSANQTEFLQRMLRKTYDLILHVSRVPLAREELRVMYLSRLRPGKLLDVGCGNGSRLVSFRDSGWEPQGQEVDPEAASEARRVSGVPVHLGPLEEAGFPDGSFDALTLSHVIEHVHDPVALLRECRRILRASGVLVITTPNSESFGHQRFGSHWRGLEPPRHLHLFSRRTLEEAAIQAGFLRWKTWTSAANTSGLVMGSYTIKASALGRPEGSAGLGRKMMAAVYQFRMLLAHRKEPSTGEECVLWAEG